jgi:glycosyltransferase involved in cell wall biosynthesis
MNTNPQTLIVSMPIYNAEKTLKKAIDSVLNQSYKNLRLILVNDNSQDRSLDIARSYLSDPRVTLLSNNRNMGAYYCRNAGIEWFKNQTWGYFTTHDADDISFEHRYLRLIKMMKSESISGIQDSWRRVRLSDEKFIKQNMTIAHAIFKRKVFEKIGYFETVEFGADWEYWKRTLSIGNELKWGFAGTQKVFGKSYVGEKNITVRIPESSPLRKKYMKSALRGIKIMEKYRDWYMPFDFDPRITKEIK